jgi:hypothetical protein
MKNTTTAPAAGRDDSARRTPGRRRRARHSDDQQPVAAVDVLDVDAVEAKAQVAAGARTGSGARGSAPRSRVKHVEVLVKIRELALLILGDLDPYPPTITRRASPHRMSEEPTNARPATTSR